MGSQSACNPVMTTSSGGAAGPPQGNEPWESPENVHPAGEARQGGGGDRDAIGRPSLWPPFTPQIIPGPFDRHAADLAPEVAAEVCPIASQQMRRPRGQRRQQNRTVFFR